VFPFPEISNHKKKMFTVARRRLGSSAKIAGTVRGMPERSAAKTAKKKAKSSRSAKKTSLLKLCAAMNKYVIDAVDKEIVKRFKILIDTIDDDITRQQLDQIMKDPESVELASFHEGLQPYVKHYIFMVKRNKK
jgi:predicted component of type VI protein secretion system